MHKLRKQSVLPNKGISLFEVLIVVAVFAILGVLASRIIVLSLRGTSKSSSLVKVRENLDYALSVMERHIRNADSIISCPGNAFSYQDENGLTGNFSCMGSGSNGYVASASARLTNDLIGVTTCSFVCEDGTSTTPPSVTINLTGNDNTTGGIGSSTVTISTKIFLRSY